MRVEALTRYPVKSMLGQRIAEAVVGATGLAGDRAFALVDDETGFVATAKHPRLWQRLLQYRAGVDDGRVRVTTPAGRVHDVGDPALVDGLADDLGRRVTLSDARRAGAEVERPDPEDVLTHGAEAVVDAPALEIAQGTPGDTFVDHSPVHLITTATLDHLGVDAVRYRPNLVLASDGGPFEEDAWPGREIRLGDVVLRVTLPTPRCSVPTLAHGDLPRAPEAVRPLMREHRVEVPGFGVLPCAGVYAEVVTGGTVRRGDVVTVA